MDGFTYYNIFDTKGIEYLIVIGFLLLLIPFWLILNRDGRVVREVRKVIGVLSAAFLKVPQGVFYNRNHTWAFLERSGIAKVGLDDMITHITGNVKIEFISKEGDKVKKGDEIARLDHEGKQLVICSPISGEIASLNADVDNDSTLLLMDPCGKGWIYGIKPSNWVNDITTCHLAGDASRWIADEIDRYKDFLSKEMQKYSPETSMEVLQDGGELIDGSLSGLPGEFWSDFQKEFLTA